MFDWFNKTIKNTLNYKGQARRKEYWYSAWVMAVIIFITLFIDFALSTEETRTVSGAIGFFLCFPNLATMVRRLHDIGKSGWWYLITAIPFIGTLILLFWLSQDTSANTNKWRMPAKRVN